MMDFISYCKGKRDVKPYRLITSPISFFYQKFKFSNTVEGEIKKSANHEILELFLSRQSREYSEEFSKNSAEFTRNLWLSLIKTKEILFEKENCLTDIYVNAEKHGISKSDINNFGYLEISNTLGELMHFKEDFFHLVDWKKASKNVKYQKLKRKLLSDDPELLTMKEDEICSQIRNVVAHNNFTVSSNNGEISITFPSGKDKKMMTVKLSHLKEYLKELNQLIDGAFIRYCNTKKVINLSNGYLKLRSEAFLDKYEGTKERYCQRQHLSEFYREKGKVYQTLILKRQKSRASILNEVNSAFNGLMCECPDQNYVELNKSLNYNLINMFDKNSTMSAWECANTKDLLLSQDALSYAQFVFTSNFYDIEKDYSCDEGLCETLGDNTNKKIEQIRNSIMHSWYHVANDGNIKFYDLNSSGEQKLKSYRRHEKRLRRSGDLSVSDAVALREAEYDLCSQDFDMIAMFERKGLVRLCEQIYQNYLETEEDKTLM